MDIFYKKNIGEIKQEYTTFLVDVLTPLIYEGIKSIYKDSIKANEQLIESSKSNPDINVMSVLKIFQLGLKEIPKYNYDILQTETNRIKVESKCGEWFEDLLKGVVKSYILLLTMSNKDNELMDKKYYEDIRATDFIHKCYIECAKSIYNNVELFWDQELSSIEIKRNQKIILDIIKESVASGIRKMLPMRLILREFLKNEYVEDDNMFGTMSHSRIQNMKAFVKKDLHSKENKDYLSSDNGYKEIDADNYQKLNNKDYMDIINNRLKSYKNSIEKSYYSDKKDKYSDKKDKYYDNKDKYSDNKDKYSDNKDKHSDKKDKYSDNKDKYSDRSNKSDHKQNIKRDTPRGVIPKFNKDNLDKGKNYLTDIFKKNSILDKSKEDNKNEPKVEIKNEPKVEIKNEPKQGENETINNNFFKNYWKE